mgnify:CR=1 FL=1
MKFRPHLLLADGTKVSVQANEWVYCTPREDDAKAYRSVEAWFTGKGGGHLTHEPLSYLPARELMKMIEEHGGIVEGDLPPLDLTGDEEE